MHMSMLNSIGFAMMNLPSAATGPGGTKFGDLRPLPAMLDAPGPSAIFDEVVTMMESVATHQSPPTPIGSGGGGSVLGNLSSGSGGGGHLDLVADQCGGDSSGSSLGKTIDACA
jgi:hypothetical protein